MNENCTRIYRRPADEVFDTILRTVLGFGCKIDRIEKSCGLLTFQTDGYRFSTSAHEMSLLVQPAGANRCSVNITGRPISGESASAFVFLRPNIMLPLTSQLNNDSGKIAARILQEARIPDF